MARLLIVEDEPTDRAILANVLERTGHEIYFASDGEEAFKACLRNNFKVIITDLSMPHVDGLEFIQAVRALFPGSFIIALSGKGQDQLDAALAAGAQVALSKPIHAQRLQKAVAAVARERPGSKKQDVRTMAPNDEPFILLVEDNPDEAALIQAALRKVLPESRTHVVFFGWEAQAYLNRGSSFHDWNQYPVPSLIILDLGLPDITGLEVLESMAESKWLAKIPVIVFTASEDPEHEQRAYALGVRRYIRKLGDHAALVDAVSEELYPRTQTDQDETEERKISE